MPLKTSLATHERTYHGPETRDWQAFHMISMFVPTTALQVYQRQNAYPGRSLLVDLHAYPFAPDRQQKDKTWFIVSDERAKANMQIARMNAVRVI
eukprot:6175698-Pleurochrysis_carterae.AAC.2